MKEFFESFNWKDWKVHALAAAIVILAELIGTIKITLASGAAALSFSLIPMLFAILIGIILAALKKVDKKAMETASPYISISVFFLIAKCACSIGPSWSTIVKAGAALILQEFGNLGTILFAMPVAMLVFKMGRVAVGACFSISREPSIAIVADKYGLDSPEGTGVMGAYVTGTILGTVFYGILVSVFSGIGCFSPEAMAMAAGTGSASMMAASLAPLVEAYPEKADTLQAFATMSNTLSNADGLYMSLLIGIPWTEHLYRLFTKMLNKKAAKKEVLANE